MLTALGPVPVVIIIKQIYTPATLYIPKWIVHHRPAAIRKWLPASALDTATQVPEADVTSDRRHHLSPPHWMTYGLCSQMPIPESDPLFHGTEGREAPAMLIAAVNKARDICARCPVAGTCLTVALVTDERYGVWGGTSGREREKLQARLMDGADLDEIVRECLPERNWVA